MLNICCHFTTQTVLNKVLNDVFSGLFGISELFQTWISRTSCTETSKFFFLFLVFYVIKMFQAAFVVKGKKCKYYLWIKKLHLTFYRGGGEEIMTTFSLLVKLSKYCRLKLFKESAWGAMRLFLGGVALMTNSTDQYFAPWSRRLTKIQHIFLF